MVREHKDLGSTVDFSSGLETTGVMLRATCGQQWHGQWLVMQISTQAMFLFMMWFMLFLYNWAEFEWWGKNHPYSPNIDNLKGRTINPEISSQVHYKGTFY